ncbi:MAG: hypothetical protein ACLFNI_01200 [Natronomonas sp.]
MVGVALVPYKAPASYAAVRRLVDRGRSIAAFLLPAAAEGLITLPVGIAPPTAIRGLLFGVAASVFAHHVVDLLSGVLPRRILPN